MNKLLNFTVNYVFTVKANTYKKTPLPSPMSVDTFLTDYIDLNGAVTKPDMIKLRDLLNANDYQQ